MAKRKIGRRAKGSKRVKTARKGRAPKRTAKRRNVRSRPRRKAVAPKSAAPRTAPAPRKIPRLDRERRRLDEDTVQTPPSSLDMDRHGSAARTGRAGMEQSRQAHATMTPAITGGDADVSVEGAYFSGDEAPGGDNPTPDQDVVDDIGKALGVQYDDAEELGGEKLTGRDKHRWELDPASSDDYKDRK